jgi:hypothetical protein
MKSPLMRPLWAVWTGMEDMRLYGRDQPDQENKGGAREDQVLVQPMGRPSESSSKMRMTEAVVFAAR